MWHIILPTAGNEADMTGANYHTRTFSHHRDIPEASTVGFGSSRRLFPFGLSETLRRRHAFTNRPPCQTFFWCAGRSSGTVDRNAPLTVGKSGLPAKDGCNAPLSVGKSGQQAASPKFVPQLSGFGANPLDARGHPATRLGCPPSMPSRQATMPSSIQKCGARTTMLYIIRITHTYNAINTIIAKILRDHLASPGFVEACFQRNLDTENLVIDMPKKLYQLHSGVLTASGAALLMNTAHRPRNQHRRRTTTTTPGPPADTNNQPQGIPRIPRDGRQRQCRRMTQLRTLHAAYATTMPPV